MQLPYTDRQLTIAVDDGDWQSFRKSLIGCGDRIKHLLLWQYVHELDHVRESFYNHSDLLWRKKARAIRVDNYIRVLRKV